MDLVRCRTNPAAVWIKFEYTALDCLTCKGEVDAVGAGLQSGYTLPSSRPTGAFSS